MITGRLRPFESSPRGDKLDAVTIDSKVATRSPASCEGETMRSLTVEATSLESAERLCTALSAFGPELICDEQDGYYVCVEFQGEGDWRLFEVLNVMAQHALGERAEPGDQTPEAHAPMRRVRPRATPSRERTGRVAGVLPGRRRNDGLLHGVRQASARHLDLGQLARLTRVNPVPTRAGASPANGLAKLFLSMRGHEDPASLTERALTGLAGELGR